MPSLITKRGKKRWRATIMVEGQRQDQLFPDNSKESFRKAVIWEKEEKQKLENQIDMVCLTVLTWANRYLDDVNMRFSDKTIKEKESAFRNLFKFKIELAELEVERITPSVALEYLTMQATNRSGNAANKERKNLAAAWDWGSKYLDYFPDKSMNPFRVVDKFPENRSPRYVPPEEDFWKVFENTEGQNRVMLLTFLHLAARRSEIFNLTWEDVDFGNRQIRLWTSKRKGGTKEFDWLPMTTELKQTLIQWWQQRPLKESPYVFVCLDDRPCCDIYYGRPYKNRQQFMRRLCKRVGVKRFGFHAIRHLTASILYHKGYDLSVIQSILRHKSPTTTNRYLRSLGLEKTREALEKGLQGPAKIIDFPKKKASGEQS